MLDLFFLIFFLYSVYQINKRIQANKTAFRLREEQHHDPKLGYREATATIIRNDEQHYAHILGLHGPTTPDDIRKKYRELVAQYHPDKVRHLGEKLQTVAEEEMKKINEAYGFFKKQYGMG